MLETHLTIILIESILLVSGVWVYIKIIHQKIKSPEISLPEANIKENYQDYRASKQWENLRKLALERAQFKCELCNAPYRAVHHIKYPKRYRDDHLDNLLVVCDICHAKLHGIRENTTEMSENALSFKESAIVQNQEKLFSKKLQTSSRLYSFEIEYICSEKKHCLTISDDRNISYNPKRYYRIEIFEEDRQAFLQQFSQMLNTIFETSNNILNNENLLFSQTLSTKERTYFFDIKIAKNGSRYFVITNTYKIESNNSFQRNNIMVFEDDFNSFLALLKEASDFKK